MCAGRSVSVTNSLATLYPAVAAQWHPTKNDDLTPDQVTAGTQKKAWWICPVDPRHAWLAVVGSRTTSGAGCPDCSVVPRSMVEIRVAYELATLTPLDPHDHRVEAGRRVLDCDMVVRDHSLVIEYDGNYWHRRRAGRDSRKAKRLNEAGWRVIRIREQPLEPITELDVRVPLGSSPKSIVDLLILGSWSSDSSPRRMPGPICRGPISRLVNGHWKPYEPSKRKDRRSPCPLLDAVLAIPSRSRPDETVRRGCTQVPV